VTTHEFNNPSDQADRKQVVKNDCYFSRAQADADMVGGRFKKETEIRVTGVPQYPTQPETSPWANDVVGVEPPLGYSVDDLGGPIAPNDAETNEPPKSERSSDDPNQ
jgi:hypothetical protein